MNALTDLLAQFPNCTVTITSRPARKKPYEGELKVLKRKGRLVRVPRRGYGAGNRFIGYQVRNGRPLWDWVAESSLTPLERGTYAHRRAERGDTL